MQRYIPLLRMQSRSIEYFASDDIRTLCFHICNNVNAHKLRAYTQRENEKRTCAGLKTKKRNNSVGASKKQSRTAREEKVEKRGKSLR